MQLGIDTLDDIVTGRLSDNDLAILYAGAAAVVEVIESLMADEPVRCTRCLEHRTAQWRTCTDPFGGDTRSYHSWRIG